MMNVGIMVESYCEELCNLIFKRYTESPSPHLYALWSAFKQCGDYVGLCLFDGSRKIADIGDDLFYQCYNRAYSDYVYYNEVIKKMHDEKRRDNYSNMGF